MKLNRVYSNNWFGDHNFSIFSHNFFNNPIKGLEIGCYEGQSSNWLVENWCKHENSSLTCIDPFTGSDEHNEQEKLHLFERFNNNIVDNSFKINVIKNFSHPAMQKLIDSGEKFNFIYIDGDHHRDVVSKDAELAHNLLISGGILAFDDYTWGLGLPSEDRPHDAINEFFLKYKDQYEIILKNWQVFARKKEENQKKLKIALYAIAKNESKFVQRFCESAKDADLILIADTGSTDDTVEKAKACGAEVHQIYIYPWRFDTARNAAMALLPHDIDVCVPIDLDEVLEPGWREEVEKHWISGTTRFSYIYDWGGNWRMESDRMHARQGYRWKHACHECMVADSRIKTVLAKTNKLLVRHLPDPDKSRGQYLDILEASSKEEPESSRDSFYYGRELMFYGKNEEAKKELTRYLTLKSSTWTDERAMVMRFIGKCLSLLGKSSEGIEWFIKGTRECPSRRETWFFLCEAYYRLKDWEKCYEAAVKCINVPYSNSWPNDPIANGPLPYDYAAISAYYSNKKKEALEYGQKALDAAPDDERIKGNMKFYL